MQNERMKEMKKEEKIKIKVDKKQIFGKVMAAILLAAMIVASCSTCIYYLVSNIK